MNRHYYLIISLLSFLIAAGGIYLSVTYISAEPDKQHLIEGSFLAAIPALYLVFLAAVFLFWIAGLISMLLNRQLSPADKIIWTLVIVFLNALGSLIYFCIIPFYKSVSRPAVH